MFEMLFLQNGTIKLSRWKTLFVWGPVVMVPLGYLLFVELGGMFFAAINWLFDTKLLSHNDITKTGSFVLSVAYFYITAIARVKEAHVGQPTILGARQKGFVLPEGFSLILPWPFMGYDEYPVQSATTELEKPMEVLVANHKAAGDSSSDEASSQVKMNVQASIVWQVDPDNILNFTSVEGGKKGVEKMLVDAMRRSIREAAQEKDMTDIVMLKGQTLIEEAISKNLNAELGEAEEVNGKKPNLKERLGIKVLRVQATKIVPASEKLISQYERLRGEELDQAAEAKQASHIIDNLAGPFKEKLGVDGDLALQAALAITKDATLDVVTGNAGDFTKGNVAAAKRRR